MGRFFGVFGEAINEIRRDLSKGTRMEYTRVQQRTGEHLPGRERMGYEYTVMVGIPSQINDLLELGFLQGFPLFQTREDQAAMGRWLAYETMNRLDPLQKHPDADWDFDPAGVPIELLHPALKTTLEGNWPAYLYRDRLVGAVETIVETLRSSPDSRRAYWPIFIPQDSFRANAPTRIPCSIGYQCLLRKQYDKTLLLMVYLQRSSDFDTFWLTDVYLARQFQLDVARRLDVEAGSFSHYIVSLHSFLVEGTEIY